MKPRTSTSCRTSPSGGEKVSAEAVLPGPGTYTVVALPLDKAQKPVSGEASAASFYFPGIRRTWVPNDIAGSLYKVSAYPDAAAYVSEYPDYFVGRATRSPARR